ncbi:MAG: restriction endonuclease [Bacteroidaceae bacterium]|nr:restriction endonuclease [Bacteroidaceae bacterium]
MDLHFNQQLAQGYHGKTQIARVMTEDWVTRNMYCPICGHPMLCHYEANKPVADFYCPSCGNDFELKSLQKQRGPLGNTINDGQYDKLIERITSAQNPNFLFMHYADCMVRNLILIPNHYFVPSIVIKRKPLSPDARRAGWTGCMINIADIPQSGKIFIVQNGEVIDKDVVQHQYQRTLFLKQGNLSSRGWTLDVMACIERIPDTDFTLDQVYAFTKELEAKHPENNFVQAKIRQQLQYLRDLGFVDFTSRGHYHKTK